jgi:hypothetical protein
MTLAMCNLHMKVGGEVKIAGWKQAKVDQKWYDRSPFLHNF